MNKDNKQQSSQVKSVRRISPVLHMSSAERVSALVPGRVCNFALWGTFKKRVIDIDFRFRALHKCVNERVMAESTAHLCFISEATSRDSVTFCY